MAKEKEKKEEKKTAEEVKEAAQETVEEAVEAKEEVKEEIKEEIKEEVKEAAPLSSTEAKRKKKADRREAKAARKEANKIEEKKKRPNNLVLTILIFGVLIGMFAFVGAYNYFSKPATIEKYMDDNGITETYKEIAFSQYTTMTLEAEKNELKLTFKVAEDAPEDELESYTGDDGTENIEEWGAYFLTSMKPQTQALSANVTINVEQGDETINSAKLSYHEAKKVLKEAEEEEEEEAEDVDVDDEDTEDDADADDSADTDADADEGADD